MTHPQLHDWIGSDKHGGMQGCVREIRKNTSCETSEYEEAGRRFQRTLYVTPHKTLELTKRYDEPSDAWHPVKFPVETREDISVMREWIADAQLEVDTESRAKSLEQEKEIGQSAVVATYAGESPLMHLVEWLAGIESAQYLLADYPDEVEALFNALHADLLRRVEILSEHTTSDMLYLIENTSTTLISPAQYRKYCFKHIMDYAQAAAAHDQPIVLHMCGHLKAVLPDLNELPVRAFEAFTSPTLGNTTLLDGRTGCPNKCLIGGTNAMLWLKPADQIIAKIEADIDVLPHHRGVVVTSAGVMPPACKPETIKAVRDWVCNYKGNFN